MTDSLPTPTASVPSPAVPASKAAPRSLAFALFILIANILLNLLAGALLSSSTSPTVAWISVVVHLLVVAILFAISLRFGLIGLRETAGGAMSGRGLAITGIILASVLLVFTVGATLLQIVSAYAS